MSAAAAGMIPSRPYWPGEAAGFETDEEWRDRLAAPFPVAWAAALARRWGERHRTDRRGANLAHLLACRKIEAAQRAGVRADANDAELCEEARTTARDMARRLEQRHGITAAEGWPLRAVGRGDRAELLAVWCEALHWMDARGLLDVAQRMRGSITSALKRLTCERWWRRILRRIHAQAVEGTARTLGLVHKRAGCYVSDDTLARRAGQIGRNARALESVEAVNEHGQRYTLAELAARGPANREIRRHELMTRIAGFEAIARDCGHVAYFVTVTCPSRMHAWRTKPGSTWATEPNPAHDGTQPDAAQAHLSRQWARFRAAADRAGLDLYGFRIAEPNHDGTPHWHALLFFPVMANAGRKRVRGENGGSALHGGDSIAGSVAGGISNRQRLGYRVAVRLLRRYFLWQCDASERGAKRHRVKVERIDWNRGSAAGYVAKYVAKNIDGFAVEKDLYGNDCLTASRRVDAWASTWRIRQFQQIGGAPVGVWRELRRLHPDQAGAAAGVALALDAVNVAASMQGAEVEAIRRHTAAHGWATYTLLQGGTRVRRQALRLRLLREQTGEVGRYGDVIAPRAVGVTTAETVIDERPAFGIVPATRTRRQVVAEVESERATWIVVPKGSYGSVQSRPVEANHPDADVGAGGGPWVSRVLSGVEGLSGARSAAPWIVVPRGTPAAALPEIPKPPGVRESVAGHYRGPMRGGAGAGYPSAEGPAAGYSRDARSAAPWSPVNNCTQSLSAIDAAHLLRRAGALHTAPGSLFGPSVVRHRKRGRWHNWKAKGEAGGPTEERAEHGQQDHRARGVPAV